MVKIKIKRLKAMIASIGEFVQLLRKNYWILKTKEICKQEGLNRVQTAEVCGIIECESGFRTDIKNYNNDGRNSYDSGIAQTNSYWYWEREKIIHPEEAINNPEKAIRILVKHYKQGRAKDWVCFSKGLFERHKYKFL